MSEIIADEVLRRLREHPRQRVPLEAVFEAMHAADMGFAGAVDRRARVGAILAQLRERDALRFPVSPKRYDRSTALALPLWVVVDSEEAQRLPRPPRPWRAELEWAATQRLSPTEERFLVAVQEFLRDRAATALTVPVKERSLDLGLDEKRLDALMRGRFFRDGRLTAAMLRCDVVHPPFVWKPLNPAGGALLVTENASTYHSLAEVLPVDGAYAGVAFGSGTHFEHSVTFVADLQRPVTGVLYFGDLDGKGLRIAHRAAEVAEEEGLPPVVAAQPLYSLLLSHGTARSFDNGTGWREALEWLPESLRGAVEGLLAGGQRMAQEAVGLELLSADGTWREALDALAGALVADPAPE